MGALTDLERAVLLSIFSETPHLTAALVRQMAGASVTARRNSGVGFFTTILVPSSVPSIEAPRVLGYETHLRLTGFKDGLGFVLFLEDGRLSLLEGYSWSGESTAELDLGTRRFEVFRAPVTRVV
ncbi:hypothetical protein VQH23_00485 [Pararoseomonas sp. SCSIO 73927]|uniref:hypothetical protein n=1 Tax=Pararoseomonas sp. SCSIO 73927 TaxID=3114537 RepID=UPI0030D38577